MLVPRRALLTTVLVGLLTPELGKRAFSSSGHTGRLNNGKLRCVARDYSVTAAGPFRIRAGFPVCRSWQVAETGDQHLNARTKLIDD